MGKSDLLRVRDVRDAYRLIGECRDLGGEPALWQMRILEGLGQLVGAAAGAGGEGIWARPVHPVQPFSAFDTGFDARGRERSPGLHARDRPGWAIRSSGPSATCRAWSRRGTRSQLVSNAEWYRSASFNEYRKLCGVDHCLTSVCRRVGPGRRQRDHGPSKDRGAGLLAPRGAAAGVLSRRAPAADRATAGQRDRAEPRDALPPPPPDARLPGRGGQREAGRGATRPQRDDGPSVRDGPVPSVRRAEPRPAPGPPPETVRASRLGRGLEHHAPDRPSGSA